MKLSKRGKQLRGSVLLISIVLLMVMLTLVMSMFTQEFISRNSALRAHTSMTQELAVDVTLQRFKDAFCARSESPVKLPVPDAGEQDYNIEFSSSSESHKSFVVTGVWKKGDSIYSPPEKNPGMNYTSPENVGYYGDFIVDGFDDAQVSPWHNLVSIKSPTMARYVAVFGYYFPFGAFAPQGRISMGRAYSVANPVDSESMKAGEHSGVPVNVYARDDVLFEEYPYGRAYSAAGVVEVRGKGRTESGRLKNGVVKYTNISVNRMAEFDNFREILEDQLDGTYRNLKEVALDKGTALFGKPVTGFSDYSLKPISGDFLTLEQSASFPFVAITSYEMPDDEEEMGNHYKLTVHCPLTPDKLPFIAPAEPLELAAKSAVGVSDEVKDVFEDADIPWQVTPTDICLVLADAYLAEEIVETTEELAEAAELPPPLDVIMGAIYAAELLKLGIEAGFLGTYEVAFFSLRTVNVEFLAHLLTGRKDEPLTRIADKSYSNVNYPLVGLCSPLNILFMRETMGTSTWLAKFVLVATILIDRTKVSHRLIHFGDGKFEDYFIQIDKKNFIFDGTITVPRGRTLKFAGNLVIKGDLWIQEGGSLFVDGDLKVIKPGKVSRLSPVAAPGGRIIIENGSSLIVEGNISCQGDEKYGSLVVVSPVNEINSITSAVMTRKGSINIPYGVMPGVSIRDLAEYARTPLWKSLEKIMENAGDLAKVAGPFFARKPFFASYAASLLFFRDKNLNNPLYPPFIVPLQEDEDNITNEVFEILTGAFSIRLNAYLGENFFTHSSWWIFGEGVIPVFPKANIDEMSKIVPEISDTRDVLLKVAELTEKTGVIGSSGKNAVDTAESQASKINSIYMPFILTGFLSPCDKVAELAAMTIKSQAERAYKKFDEVREEGEKLQGKVDNARQSFARLYKSIDDVIADDEKLVFQSIPGVLIYSGNEINIGIASLDNKPDGDRFLPLSGMLIAKNDLVITGRFNAVGSLMSLEGNITAPDSNLQFYPYFTKASIYLPKDLKGNISDEFLLTGDGLSGKAPLNVGITIPRLITEGWETYSELYPIREN